LAILWGLIWVWGSLAVKPSYESNDQIPEIGLKIKMAEAEDEELRLASRFPVRSIVNVHEHGLGKTLAMRHGRLLAAASR
jgi:hypothetical protein